MNNMKYFKRRVKDTKDMLKDLYSVVTWLNFIWVVPCLIPLTFFIIICMLAEDYELKDSSQEIIDYHVKNLNKTE